MLIKVMGGAIRLHENGEGRGDANVAIFEPQRLSTTANHLPSCAGSGLVLAYAWIEPCRFE